MHDPQDQILSDKADRVRTMSAFRDQANYVFVSEIEPKNIEEALADNDWIMAVEEELNQFTRNDVWTLVPKPPHKVIIGTRWVFRNKLDE